MKPENVLLSWVDGQLEAKLTDMGLVAVSRVFSLDGLNEMAGNIMFCICIIQYSCVPSVKTLLSPQLLHNLPFGIISNGV